MIIRTLRIWDEPDISETGNQVMSTQGKGLNIAFSKNYCKSPFWKFSYGQFLTDAIPISNYFRLRPKLGRDDIALTECTKFPMIITTE